MIIRKLGPAGSEYTLPSIAIILPVTMQKKLEIHVMSDGSLSPSFFKGYHEWSISFSKLTKTQLNLLKFLDSLQQILRWQNPDESYAWYDVAMHNFFYDTKDPKSPTTFWYGSMTLTEII